MDVLSVRPGSPMFYTTNPNERSSAATERSISESDLEPHVESHRALAKHLTDLLGHCLASTWWDSIDDSKSLSLVELSLEVGPYWWLSLVYTNVLLQR